MFLLNLRIFTGISFVSSHLLLSNKVISLKMSSSITGLINNEEQVETVLNDFGELVFGRKFANLDAIYVKQLFRHEDMSLGESKLLLDSGHLMFIPFYHWEVFVLCCLSSSMYFYYCFVKFKLILKTILF